MTTNTILTNFAIDYTPMPQHSSRVLTHRTDDPVEAEEFLMHLLAVGACINAIRHEGTKLTDHQTDQMLRIAAEKVASVLLSTSLKIDSVSVKHRFGFAA